MHTWESAGAMTDLGECAKPAPRSLNRAPHAAISENELSLHVVHPCRISCASVGTTMLVSEMMNFPSFCLSVDYQIFFYNKRRGKNEQTHNIQFHCFVEISSNL